MGQQNPLGKLCSYFTRMEKEQMKAKGSLESRWWKP